MAKRCWNICVETVHIQKLYFPIPTRNKFPFYYSSGCLAKKREEEEEEKTGVASSSTTVRIRDTCLILNNDDDDNKGLNKSGLYWVRATFCWWRRRTSAVNLWELDVPSLTPVLRLWRCSRVAERIYSTSQFAEGSKTAVIDTKTVQPIKQTTARRKEKPRPLNEKENIPWVNFVRLPKSFTLILS